jgi:hypothetical protein
VRKHTLNVYDSIPNEGRKYDILHRVRAYIREEHKSKYGLPYPYALNEESSQTCLFRPMALTVESSSVSTPRQSSEGVRFNFRSKDMQVIRRTMIWEIAHG